MVILTYIDKGVVLRFLAHGMLQLSSHCYVVGDLFLSHCYKVSARKSNVLRTTRRDGASVAAILLLLALPGLLALIF